MRCAIIKPTKSHDRFESVRWNLHIHVCSSCVIIVRPTKIALLLNIRKFVNSLTSAPWIKQHNDIFRMLVTILLRLIWTTNCGLRFDIELILSHNCIRWWSHLKAHAFFIDLSEVRWPCFVNPFFCETYRYPNDRSFALLRAVPWQVRKYKKKS